MMATRLALFLVISGVGLSSSAEAQPAQTDAAPSTAAAQISAAASDQDLERFAAVTVKLNALPAREPEALAAVIAEAGLSVERYNEIAARMGSDPAFASQVNTLLQKAAAASNATGPVIEPDRSAAAQAIQLPTSGDGAAVLDVLGNVCASMVRNDQHVSVVAPKHGFRQNRKDGTYTRVLGSKPYSLTVLPRGANQDVCMVELRYPLGGERPIINALNAWAALHQPQMKIQRNDVATGADGIRRRTLAWEHYTPKESVGLVFVQLQKPDGSPLDQGYESATLLYSERHS